MNTFAVSDFHLKHFTSEERNILVYDKRPYLTVEDMYEDIVKKTNERVKREDRLIYAGDLAFGQNKIHTVKEFLDRLHCKNVYYVRGNHDGECYYNKEGERFEKGWSYQYKQHLLEEGYLKCIEDVLYVRWTNPRLFVTHYSHRVWPEQGHGVVHLYGHSHHNLEDDPHTLSMDIGCNGNNYYPYGMDDIRAWMNLKTPKQQDHH